VTISKNINRAITVGPGLLSDIEMLFSNSKSYRQLQDKLEKTHKTNKPIEQVTYGFSNIIGLLAKYITKFRVLPFMTDIAVKLKAAGLRFNVKNVLKFISITDILIPYKALISRAKNPLTWITLPVAYRVERAANNFATMYGYGPAELSYLEKMQTKDKIKLVERFIKHNPAVGIMYDMILAPSKILNGVFDTTPSGIARSKDQIEMLKYELRKTDLDPKMRDVIASDLALCEKNLKKLVDVSKGAKDPDICKRLYNKALNDYLNGVGLKEIIIDDKNKFEKYDQNYNKRKEGLETNG
jgi:hypothetical protein